MRSEQEMLGLILGFARQHDDVRAVVMNGSRVNPNAKKDPFQDYDIVYFVHDVEPYRRNMDIPPYFGELMILQLPDDMGDPAPEQYEGYCYLMQFMDGNRIDLTFQPLEATGRCHEDSLAVVLLDKDKRIGALPPPGDAGYLPRRPAAKQFEDCCNEFWWLNPYVAKGLWRGELTYAKYMLDTLMRHELMKMLNWHLGVMTDFKRAPGKEGKYLKGNINPELWDLLERTCADAQSEHMWQALFAMGELFQRAALPVAAAFSFAYPLQEAGRVSDYIRRIRGMAHD